MEGIVLLLSLRCNLRCTYCFAQESMVSGDFMSYATFRKALGFFQKELKKGEILPIKVAGGEPTQNPEIGRILGYLRQRKFLIPTLLTNGIFDKEVLAELTKFKPNQISFLMNVNDPKWIGRKNFGIIKRNIETLLPYDLTIGINFFEPDQDSRYIIDLAKKYGLKVRWSLAHPIGGDHLYVSPENYKGVGRTVCSFLETCARHRIPTNADCSTPLCLFDESDFVTHNLGNISCFCDPPTVIDPDLNVSLCYEPVGKKLLSFKEPKALFKLLDGLRGKRRNKFWLEECRTCFRKDFDKCGGGCPHHIQRANNVYVKALDERGLGVVRYRFSERFRHVKGSKGKPMLKNKLRAEGSFVLDPFMERMTGIMRNRGEGSLLDAYRGLRKGYKSCRLGEFKRLVDVLVDEGVIYIWREGDK